MQQQRAFQVLDAVVFFAHLQQPGIVVFIVDIARRHREVLGVDQLAEDVDGQQVVHIGVGERAGLGLLILFFVLVVQFLALVHLALGLGDLEVSLQLGLGHFGVDRLELVQQFGHPVQGVQDVLHGAVDHVQALLDLQGIHQVAGGGAVPAGLLVQPLLQLLQGHGQLIGQVADLRYHVDQVVDVPQAGGGDLVHDLVQAVPHADQGRLDLRLVDKGDQVVDGVHQGLDLAADLLGGLRDHAGHTLHHARGKHVAKGVNGLLQLGAAVGQLLGGGIQLLFGQGQLGVHLFQQQDVQRVDLLLVQLHLDVLVDQAGGGNAGHALLAFQLGDDAFFQKVAQFIDIGAFPAHGHRHQRAHVHAQLQDGGGQADVGQAVGVLVQGVGHLDHGAVHVGVGRKAQLHDAVVFRRGGRDAGYARHRAQGAFQHLGDFGLHLFGAGAGVHRHHHQVGCAHLGQQVGAQVRHRYKAHQKDDQDRHQHGKRLFYAVFFHESSLFDLGPSATVPRRRGPFWMPAKTGAGTPFRPCTIKTGGAQGLLQSGSNFVLTSF